MAYSDEEEDVAYQNDALLDFPSDADIKSYEQTPKRTSEY